MMPKRKYVQRNGQRYGAYEARNGRIFTYEPNNPQKRAEAYKKATTFERIFSGRANSPTPKR